MIGIFFVWFVTSFLYLISTIAIYGVICSLLNTKYYYLIKTFEFSHYIHTFLKPLLQLYGYTRLEVGSLHCASEIYIWEKLIITNWTTVFIMLSTGWIGRSDQNRHFLCAPLQWNVFWLLYDFRKIHHCGNTQGRGFSRIWLCGFSRIWLCKGLFSKQ